MKKLKKFEEHTILNSSELGNNLSAEYILNKKKGLKPYIKIKGKFEEIEEKKSIPSKAIYLKPEKAKKYNDIADKIIELQKEQEKIIK
jgi:hypothetical protein